MDQVPRVLNALMDVAAMESLTEVCLGVAHVSQMINTATTYAEIAKDVSNKGKKKKDVGHHYGATINVEKIDAVIYTLDKTSPQISILVPPKQVGEVSLPPTIANERVTGTVMVTLNLTLSRHGTDTDIASTGYGNGKKGKRGNHRTRQREPSFWVMLVKEGNGEELLAIKRLKAIHTGNGNAEAMGNHGGKSKGTQGTRCTLQTSVSMGQDYCSQTQYKVYVCSDRDAHDRGQESFGLKVIAE